MEVRVGAAASRALKAREPALLGDAPADARVLVRIIDVRQPPTGDWFVRVFVNLPTASATTPITDPHYAGSFAFFNDPDVKHAGHAGGHGATHASFLVDATRTLQRLRGLDQLRSSGEVTISLVPVRAFEGPPRLPALAIGGLELQLVQSLAAEPRPFGSPKDPQKR
jgi:tyrosinase